MTNQILYGHHLTCVEVLNVYTETLVQAYRSLFAKRLNLDYQWDEDDSVFDFYYLFFFFFWSKG
jgi:hypothetical protein